jgi:hypothetical protein
MTPMAESWPRESFLIRRSSGSRKSATRRSARAASQLGKNHGALRKTCFGLKSSGYFWLSLMKQTLESTPAFSTGFSPKTEMLPEVRKSWPVRSCIMVVLPAPLRPSSP